MFHRGDHILQSLPHRSCVMQYSPSVNHVERSKLAQVGLFQGRAPFDLPIRVPWEKSVLQLESAGDGLRIIVKGENSGSELSSSETEKATPAPNIQERLLIEILDPEHAPKRGLGFENLFFVEASEEALPILPELEPFLRCRCGAKSYRRCTHLSSETLVEIRQSCVLFMFGCTKQH